jgi:hypothetical protein
MKLIKTFYLFCLLLVSVLAFPRQEIPLMPYTRPTSYVLMEKIVENGDTIFLDQLRELFVYPPIIFKSKKQETFYWRTVRDVKKALPYARLASVEIDQLNRELLQLGSNSDRKKHIGEFQKRIFRQHEKSLRNLTVNQGRMLIKLIDREHGINTFDLIKAYKGGFPAIFWNTIAKFFGSDLRSEYDGNDKDKIVERVITLVDAGQL